MISDAFSGYRTIYATTMRGLAERDGIAGSYLIADCNRHRLLAGIGSALDLLRVIRASRPDMIVSTGAAPGLVAILIGFLFGIKTVWIDSIANAEKLSMSGWVASYVATLSLTQWSHLSRPRGPVFLGSIL